MAKTIGTLLSKLTARAASGVDWEAREQAAIARAAEERAAQAAERCLVYARWGIPAKDVNLLAGGRLRQTPALTIAMQLVAGDYGPGVTIALFSGRNGCGKSTAAAWWLAYGRHRVPSWNRTTERPCFITAEEVNAMGRFGHERDRVVRARALVLDELGEEYMDAAGNWNANLGSLLNARYAQQLPTLITANLDLPTFAERYGKRIVSRMREAGRFFSVDGPSLRSPKDDAE